MNLVVVFCFLIYAIYSINHRDCIFNLTVFNYLLRMINHTWGFSIQIVKIAGISIYTSDVYLIVLIFLLIVDLTQNQLAINIYKSENPFLIYSLMVLTSCILGFLQFGFCSDWIGDVRKMFGFMVPVFYFSSHPVEMNQKNLRMLTLTMRGILIYCCICWFSALVLGNYLTPNGELRCMASDYAMVVAIYTIYLFYRDLVLSDSGTIRLETILFIFAIIILQHNSVYMVLVVGIITILLLEYGKVFLQNPKWIVQIGIIVLLIIAFLFTSVGQGLMAQLTQTFDKFQQASMTADGAEEGTIGTRYVIWKELINTLDTPIDWLFGKNMGAGYHVSYLNSRWEASPHSGYIEGLMRVGLVGMLGLILQVLYNVISHFRRKEALYAAVLLGLLVYWFPYSYSAEAGFMLGMSIALLKEIVPIEFLEPDLKRG